MTELDHQSTSHRVMRLSNLGAASSGEPKNDIHERHKVKDTISEKDNLKEPKRDTSLSIRDRLKGNISWNNTRKEIQRNRVLLGRQYNVIHRINQGTIYQIVLRNNKTYLIDPTDQNNTILIHVEVHQRSSIPTFPQIRHRSTSSSHRSGTDTFNSSSDDLQRENRKSKTHLPIEYYQPSSYRRPTTISSGSSSTTSERENLTLTHTHTHTHTPALKPALFIPKIYPVPSTNEIHDISPITTTLRIAPLPHQSAIPKTHKKETPEPLKGLRLQLHQISNYQKFKNAATQWLKL
ncbi:e8cad8c9-bda8-4ce4-85cb-42f3252d17fe [Sclerotinia trifoliorum]|uniref:E8cad8c9-bda8-4ce4-85cb-42f3252d17fe n=1 Tax=Sclerotinia trifoliorum TaxID=28548 RepID=A0A8H2VLV0_9HELO|nr:e8cad8c9-bda8-4ce4-85cb-42f3252d17fe [Sclerotinia trifoliorum]